MVLSIQQFVLPTYRGPRVYFQSFGHRVRTLIATQIGGEQSLILRLPDMLDFFQAAHFYGHPILQSRNWAQKFVT